MLPSPGWVDPLSFSGVSIVLGGWAMAYFMVIRPMNA
jgi:hypothetical protein